jgi:D-inositol-3-phosphate glycosyltransferase
VRHGDANPYASERFRAWRAREAELAAAADHVFTLSQVMRSDLAARGVDPSRITVVPNGIDAALLERHSTPADARRSLGLPVEGLWVGAVTSVVHYEGLSGLLDAVALARGNGVDVRAAIVGDGLAWPDLQRQVEELGLQDVVHLPGRLARPLALTWLEALDVVAVPREDYEVTRLVPPLKVAEAMGVGRPVIASNLPALAELVTHRESGLLVPPQDPAALAEALVTLAEDAALRDRLTAAGRQVAAGLTWQELAHTYRGVYESVSAVSGSVGASGTL